MEVQGQTDTGRDCQEPQHHHCCFGRPPRGLFSVAPLILKAWALLCCAVNRIEAAAAVMLCRPSRRCLFSVVPSNLKAWALLCCAVIDNEAAAAALLRCPSCRCLFPAAAGYDCFLRVTNPHEFEVDGVQFLGTSGQNVDDIAKYSRISDRCAAHRGVCTAQVVCVHRSCLDGLCWLDCT